MTMFKLYHTSQPRGDIQSQVIEWLRFPLAVLVVMIHMGSYLGRYFYLDQLPPPRRQTQPHS